MLFANIRRIVGNVRHAGNLLWIVVLSTVTAELILLTIPKLGERAIHAMELRSPYETVLFWCTILAGVSFLFVCSTLLRWRIRDYMWGRIFVAKTQEYKTRLLGVNYATLLEYGTGKLISRFSRGIDAEVDFMNHCIDIVLSGGIRLTGALVIIGLYSVWLSLGFLIFLVLVAYVQLRISARVAPLAQDLETRLEEDKRNLARIVTENFLIRTSGRTTYELDRNADILKTYAWDNFRYEASAWGIFHLLELGFRWVEATTFALLGWYVLGWTLPLSVVPMMGTYIWLAWDPIADFLMNLRTMSRGYETYLRMREVLDTPDRYTNGDVHYVYNGGTISLKEATFWYADTVSILKNFTLDIVGGKTTAFVGHSGSGKSTIMKLLLRIYDPNSGSILYDGQPLTELRIDSVYDRIGYLSQEPAIFDGSVRENLSYATNARTFSDEELWYALGQARLDDRIRQFDRGLDTEIGERGVRLSGGEKQRLAIARIFLKNPDIVFLDEPTSALDSISEKIIADLLVTLTRGKTVVIIAHRLQTVMHADVIHVLDHGTVVESGTHAELLARGGTYATLVDLQTGMLRE